MHFAFDSISAATLWHQYRGPLTAAGATAGLAVAARLLGADWLRAAAGGLGAALGWSLLAGGFSASPRLLLERLPLAALVATVVPLLAARFGPRRAALAGTVLAAALCGWWLAGGPRDRADLLQAWPVALGVAAMVLLMQRAGTGQRPTALAGAAGALVVALKMAGLPLLWSLLSQTVVASSLVLLALPSGEAALPALLAALGLTATAVVIASGRLPRGGFGPVDLAAVVPLLVLWMAPRLEPRLRFAGAVATTLAAMLAAVLAVGLFRLALLPVHAG